MHQYLASLSRSKGPGLPQQRRMCGTKLSQVNYALSALIKAICRLSNIYTGLVSAWSKALDILRKAGADVEEIALPSEFCQIDLWHKIILHMEGRAAFLGDYRRGKEHMDDFLHEQTENRLGWTKKQLTEAYDGMATLRRQFDEIAIRYDVVLVPSVPDEAPEGITSTGFADCK